MVANEYYASQTIYNIMANNPIEQNRYVGVYCPLFDDMLCLLLLLKDWLFVLVLGSIQGRSDIVSERITR